MCMPEKKNMCKRIVHLLQYYSVELQPYIRSNVLVHIDYYNFNILSLHNWKICSKNVDMAILFLYQRFYY